VARIRTIKPEFWRDENLSSLCPEAALLAIGLLNHADDEGYFNANPKLVESDVFPLRDLEKSTAALMDDLHKIGYIEIYCGSDGKRYGHIVNFSKHQVISKKNHSKIKPLLSGDDSSKIIPVPVQESSSTDLVEVQVGTGNREQGKEQEKERTRKQNALRFDAIQHLVDEGVREQIAVDWIAVRKAKKAAVTKTAIDGIKKEASKIGYSLDNALEVCCKNGWAGFSADWLNKASTHNLSFAERDEILKRKKYEEMTGRPWPEDDVVSAPAWELLK
jgi:hypothetical protein